MAKNNLTLAASIGLLTLCGAAEAQTSFVRPDMVSPGGESAYLRPVYRFPERPPVDGPASIQLGDTPLYFTPSLGLAAGRDDNVLYSSRDERASPLYIVSPGLKLDARDANKVFQLSYEGQIGRYTDSEPDDYVDHTTLAQFDLALGARNFLRFAGEYLRAHDPRGFTDRTVAGSPDRYRLSGPAFTYAFGAPGAEGRLETYYSDVQRRYLNNLQFTRGSDRNTREVGGAFYWRVMPRTYALAEVRRTHIGYIEPGSPYSGREDRIFGGVSWEASAATTGTIKAGRLEKRFDSDFPKFSGSSWEASLTWLPRTYSRFELFTLRTPNESTGRGSFILSSITGLSWNHAWSSAVSTGIDLRYQKDQYQNLDRTDETKSIGLRVGYRFRRWLTLGASYTHNQRDSSQGQFDYDKNVYFLTASGSL